MSSTKTHNTGQLINALLPERTPHGYELKGVRPCVLLVDPAGIQPIRYPMLIVAPLTTKELDPLPLYIRLDKATGGLPRASTVLLDQLLTIDTRRVRAYIGTLTKQQFSPIAEGLSFMFKYGA
jgi:mRNA-degrading endonuclease toxin of MazEF toxin-antitoxin module